jgi:hypothetical protein
MAGGGLTLRFPSVPQKKVASAWLGALGLHMHPDGYQLTSWPCFVEYKQALAPTLNTFLLKRRLGKFSE